jgi:glycosyltransferase involved in cell wall biosynthesis
MRVLIFHGYLLGGTGSNVYNAHLAQALRALGHEVHLLCQERHPERHAFIDAAADWDSGGLALRELRAQPAAGRCTVYRPDIGGLLPVYVADDYEGLRALTFAECSDEQVADYVRRNVAAVREVCALAVPEAALANHLVMGPAILARALGGACPYAVKVHGSALEYTVKRDPGRFLAYAREGLAGAGGVLVGSHHTASSLWRAIGDPQLPARTRLGPPGVDVLRFVPQPAAAAREGLRALAARLAGESAAAAAADAAAAVEPAAPVAGADAFARDPHEAARALARVDPAEDRLVAFVGKLIVSKGVDLLVAAWPLVLEREPRARLVVVGFGAYRDGVEQLIAALADGDLDAAVALARRGRGAESSAAPDRPLRHLLAFLEALQGEPRERYLAAATRLRERALLSGRLDHEELAELLPACEALVVPSTFPEAFGMVAAEAAACGALPVSAAHSGLAEVSEELARAVPAQVAPWLSFPVDDHAVGAIAERLVAWLGAGAQLRERARAGLVATVRERWSWEGVAEGVLAAAGGELGRLRAP